MNHKIEAKTQAVEVSLQLLSIPIDQITTSPHQARKQFDEYALNALAESMRQEGLIQPITVKIVSASERIGVSESHQHFTPTPPNAGKPVQYELVSGERRLRAAKLLGWTTIPARIIQTISAGETAAKGLIENLQREDLNPMEEAEGFSHLNKISPDYWSQTQIAKVTGRTQGYVSQSLSLLKLAPEIQENIRRLIYSRSLGLEIGRIEDHGQQRKVAKALGKHPTIKKARKRVDMELGWKSRKTPRKASVDPLAPVWTEVLSDPSIAPECAWKVEYKEETWQFSVTAPGKPPISSLYEWFHAMTKSLKNADSHTKK